jgi:hypothetical protein
VVELQLRQPGLAGVLEPSPLRDRGVGSAGDAIIVERVAAVERARPV